MKKTDPKIIRAKTKKSNKKFLNWNINPDY